MTEQIMRRRGWELALADVVAMHGDQPFEWGKSDCLTMVADAALAMTGIDPLADYRGRYKSARGAKGKMRQAGYADVGEAIASQFGEVAPAMARRGDIGLVETVRGTRRELAAVVILGANVVGKTVAAKGATAGLTTLGRDRLVRAFRVGW